MNQLSVVMSVYNAEKYLSEAIESVLSQSFSDFELIIINDGSTDRSTGILLDYAKKDNRIKLMSQKNQGLVNSLNRGIKAAKGIYVARQDADDKSAPDRLKKQDEFLKSHPETVIVGSSISVIDNKSRIRHRHAVLLNDLEIKQELLVRSPFAHGSVMFKRREAVKAGLYHREAWPAEDYDFWLRLSYEGKMANLDEDLYFYREHGKSISEKNAELQQQKLKEVQDKAWKERSRLMPKKRIDLSVYKNLDMGQERIERIISNTVFVSKEAWRNKDKTLALKNMMIFAGEPVIYKKTAGKLKRKVSK